MFGTSPVSISTPSSSYETAGTIAYSKPAAPVSVFTPSSSETAGSIASSSSSSSVFTA